MHERHSSSTEHSSETRVNSGRNKNCLQLKSHAWPHKNYVYCLLRFTYIALKKVTSYLIKATSCLTRAMCITSQDHIYCLTKVMYIISQESRLVSQNYVHYLTRTTSCLKRILYITLQEPRLVSQDYVHYLKNHVLPQQNYVHYLTTTTSCLTRIMYIISQEPTLA